MKVITQTGVLAAAWLGSLHMTSVAATYSVNNQHPKAADANAGTETAPFTHIQAAVDKVRPGDIITVHAGTYREFIVWKTSGTNGLPITLQATHKIEIRCPQNMRDWSDGDNAGVEFRREQDTCTVAAWTGTSRSFPKIAIYRMAWANPKPGVKIKEIEMVGISGMPGLLGVTLGLR